MRFGVIKTDKSLTIQFPNLPSFAVAPFIRGYFDGNGTIYTRNRGNRTEYVCRFINGSPDFLEILKAHLHSVGIKTLAEYRNQDSNAYVLPISSAKENLNKFSDLLYTDSKIHLERKRQIFAKTNPKLQN